jgi:hypothetical protein
MKEIKVLSLRLDRRQADLILDVTHTEIHHWERSNDDEGKLDLYITIDD